MRPSPRRWLLPGLLLAALAAPAAGPAAEPAPDDPRRVSDGPIDFRTFSLSLSGGIQWWHLSILEEFLDERATYYATDGFRLGGAAFGPAICYGLEFQVRLTDDWFVRSALEWGRARWEVRDRATIKILGSRQAISVTYETRVATDHLLFACGLGRAFRTDSFRFSLSANGLLAPLRVRDRLQLFLEEVDQEAVVEAAGTGRGLEAVATVDYLTDTRMTLFVDLFYRLGDTDVELEGAAWESPTLPHRRRVDLDGAGFRLGVRWI